MKQITFQDFSLQGTEITNIRKQIEENRFVHAILISGEPGIGKKTLAGLIAKAVLCSADHNRPCGICDSCRLMEAGEHPDQIIIQKGIPLSAETKKGRSTIPVSDIREMISMCSRYAYKSNSRVVMIPEAEDMTIQAQNCLLKILEEPPSHTFFILTTSKPSDILITVKSRCRPVKMVPWETDYIRKQLVESGVSESRAAAAASSSGGSIGRAYTLAADDDYWNNRNEIIHSFFQTRNRSEVLKVSNGWKERKMDGEMLFTFLENAVHILLESRLYDTNQANIQDYSEEWILFSRNAELERFAFLLDSIAQARKQLSFNVNFQAIFEQLYLVFIGECAKWAK